MNIAHTMKYISNYIARSLTIFIVLLVFLVPVFVPALVSAQTGGGSNTQTSSGGATGGGSNTAPRETFTLSNPLKVDSVGGLVQNFIEIFSYVAILFAVLALIWVGFQFILARGNSDRMNELKDWLLWIVIGVAVIIGARIIIQVVINTLSVAGTVEPGTLQSVQRAVDGN